MNVAQKFLNRGLRAQRVRGAVVAWLAQNSRDQPVTIAGMAETLAVEADEVARARHLLVRGGYLEPEPPGHVQLTDRARREFPPLEPEPSGS